MSDLTHLHSCAECGGPIPPKGGVEQDDVQVHAVCSVTENGDLDMNPERRRRRRKTLRYILKNYGSIANAPDWIARPFENIEEGVQR